MKQNCFRMLALGLVTCAGTMASGATIIPTNLGPLGADAELRDETPGTNRGANFELATRIANNGTVAGGNDGGDRGSEMYLRFDIRNVTPSMLNAPITLRMHYGRSGMTAGALPIRRRRAACQPSSSPSTIADCALAERWLDGSRDHLPQLRQG